MATASEQLQPSPDTIASFLRESVGSDFHLVAITPDGPISAAHFGNDLDKAVEWACAENARGRGMYWTVNRVRDGFHGKPTKADITEARFVHVDIDPPKDGGAFDKAGVMERLCALRSEPSFVVDSGGGLQSFWRLEDAAANPKAIEDINAGVADLFKADRCHSIEHLMRLPGTVNWPNKKKAAAGRKPAPAQILIEDQGVFHDPIALAAQFPRTLREQDNDRAKVDVSGPYALLTADDLKLGPLDPLRSLIDHPQGRDRSGDALACAGRMVRDGYSDAQILGVLMNPSNAVHQHIGDQRDPRYQALRCIEKARTPSGAASADHGADVAAALGFGDRPSVDKPAEIDELPGQIDPGEWHGKQAPFRRFIVPGWIIRGAAGLLSGQEGVGKSLLGQQMATCSAAGRSFLGLEIAAVKSIYISCEDPLDEMWRRQEAINAALGLRMSDLSGRLKLVSLKGKLGNELCSISQDGKITPATRFAQIYRTSVDFGANLVFLDNAAHFFPGNENDRHQVAAFLGLIERLAEDIDGAVILLAHPNKQHAQGNTQGNEFSGSTGWSAHVRNRLFLDWAGKNEDGSPIDDDGRLLRKSKANYGKKGEEITFRWHEWAFSTIEDLGPNRAAELAQVVQASHENDVYLKCLDVLTEQKRNVSHSPNAMNYAPKMMAGMIDAGGMKKAAFVRAHERLLHLRKIVTDAQLWLGKDRHFVVGIARAEVREGAGRSSSTAWSSGVETPRKPGESDVREGLREGLREGRGIVRDGASQVTENIAVGFPEESVLSTSYIDGAAREAAAPSGIEVEAAAETRTRFPPAQRSGDTDLSEVVFPAEPGPPGMSKYPPLHLRDEFNPEHWPEDEHDRDL